MRKSFKQVMMLKQLTLLQIATNF